MFLRIRSGVTCLRIDYFETVFRLLHSVAVLNEGVSSAAVLHRYNHYAWVLRVCAYGFWNSRRSRAFRSRLPWNCISLATPHPFSVARRALCLISCTRRQRPQQPRYVSTLLLGQLCFQHHAAVELDMDAIEMGSALEQPRIKMLELLSGTLSRVDVCALLDLVAAAEMPENEPARPQLPLSDNDILACVNVNTRGVTVFNVPALHAMLNQVCHVSLKVQLRF